MIKYPRKKASLKGNIKMKEDVIFIERKGELVARLLPDIDHHTCRIMREKIDLKLFENKPERLVLDFTEVGFMDSSGLGLILGRVEKASSLNATVVVRGLSESHMRIVRLSGLDRVKNLTLK